MKTHKERQRKILEDYKNNPWKSMNPFVARRHKKEVEKGCGKHFGGGLGFYCGLTKIQKTEGRLNEFEVMFCKSCQEVLDKYNEWGIK